MKNIISRKNKGTGLVNEINATLVEMMPGQDNFEIATLLRNTILVSSLLFNSKTWFGLTNKEITLLEKVDENLQHKVLNCSSKTPRYLMYLDLGWTPLRFIIQSRRMNFLKYILDQKESSLLRRAFNKQKNKPKTWRLDYTN